MIEAYANLRTGEAFTELFTCTKHSRNGDIVVARSAEGITSFKKIVPANVGLWIDSVTNEELLEAFQKGQIDKAFLP